jgi:cytochrome c-type biogenesis protein CcmH
MLWFALVVLAAGAGALVALPFLRTRATVEAPNTPIDIYKTQLDDLARDQAAGEFDEAAAAELRVEIERRILAAPATAPPKAAAGADRDRVTAIAVAAIVVVGAAVLYAATGQPNAPSAARAGAAAAGANASMRNLPDVDTLIERLRQRLETQPADAGGWRMLGWSYQATGRFDDAVAAYRNAIGIEPANADYQSGLGEALTSANGGRVSGEALAAFRRAIASEPGDERARYFLARHKAQSGNVRGAIDDWIAALRAAAPDSQWAPLMRADAEAAAREAGIDIAARLPPAPASALGPGAQAPPLSPEAMAQARRQSPEDQQAMINGMVEGLEQRLAANPRDAEGWVRLMRSRMVLGQGDRARAAYQRALAVFTGDRTTQQILRAAATELAVPGAD